MAKDVCHTLGSTIWVFGRQVMLSWSSPETFWCETVHSNNSTSMVLHPSPLSFSPLRRSRALHCRGWLSRPLPRQLPPRVPMPQTATLLSTLLPLRLLLSLSPPLPPSMPPPPLALVTRSANWTLRTEWEGLACLETFGFLHSFSFLSLVRHNPCTKFALIATLPLLLSLTIRYAPSFPRFQWFPPKNEMLLKDLL